MADTPAKAAPDYQVMDRQGRIHHFSHFPTHQHVMEIEGSGVPDKSFSLAALASARPAAAPAPKPAKIPGTVFLVGCLSLLALAALAAAIARKFTTVRGQP